MLPDAYPDDELKPYWDQISLGYTYKEATTNIDWDRDRIESNMNDLEFRCHLLDLAMVAYHTGWRKGIYYPELDERGENDGV